MDLSEFLLARIAEDEAAAQAAEPGPWRTEKYDANVLLTGERANAAVAIGPWGSDIGDSAVHMVRWDPSRVLAECEAKRRIVERWREACAVLQGELSDEDPQDDGAYTAQTEHDTLLAVLRLLALPYADQPDYDAGWRP